MKRTREHPSVILADGVGAVACAKCGGVHIDLADENDNVIATGFLNYEQWQQLIGEVSDELAEFVLQGLVDVRFNLGGKT